MHMQNLGRELLHSLPVEVEFAGFRSNTLGLARAGWDLSMKQGMSMYNGAYEMQLAMKHGGANLHAVSWPLEIPYSRIGDTMAGNVRMAELLATMLFRIQRVGADIVYQGVHDRQAFLRDWQAIDAIPQERGEPVSVRDFKFFKVSNPTLKDIIVAPEHVPQLLEMVLKVQSPEQAEIRARERSRENLERMREGYDVKPAHQVQAQIITLARTGT